MCSFFHAAQRQTSGFDGLRGIPSRGCALQLDIVEEMAGGRQEARNREAGRRKDGTTHDPRTSRKGRLRPVKLRLIHPAAVSTCCPFWFTENAFVPWPFLPPKTCFVTLCLRVTIVLIEVTRPRTAGALIGPAHLSGMELCSTPAVPILEEVLAD